MPRKPKEENLELAKMIGKQIEQAMRAISMTVSDLHKATGISRTVLLAYTRGQYAPGARELKLLCEHLQVTPNVLLYGTNDIAPNPYQLGDLAIRSEQAGNLATVALLALCTHAERTAVLTLVEGLVAARDPIAHKEAINTIRGLLATPEGHDFIVSIGDATAKEIGKNVDALRDLGKIAEGAPKGEKPQK